LTVIGAVTMVLGGWIAIVQFDLKRVLAFSTIGALGMCTFLLGIGGEYALPAVLVFLVSHALYKGALFLVTGILDHETGTRDISRLGGLARKMPISAMAALLAGLSMAGIPPLLGFISKEMLYEAALHHACSHALTGIAVAGSAFFVVVAILASVRPFLGEATTTPRPAHEAPLSMWLGPLALAALSLAVGLWPAFGVEPVLSAAGAAVLGRPVAIHLTIWHGWTLPLALSAATVLLGLVILAARRRLVDVASRWPHLAAWGPAHGYELALNGLNRLAAAQTRFLQSGYLRFYLLIVLAVTVALTGWLLVPNARLIDFSYADLRFYHVGLAALILLATLATLLARSRLTAIAALGVVGYCVALVFVVFGAPDIAMTQFLIETLTVIVFVLVFINVPEGSASVGSEVKSVAAGVRAAAGRARDLAVAAAVGGLMTSLVLIAVHVQLYPSISTYYARHSQPEGHGRNVVNVILVDFRGLDTLGEITVLAAAGVGVYALLKLKGPRTEKESPPPRAVETAAEGQDPATGARA
jgi:multicomponent Na+:H+ antiporter subunit A